MSGWLPWLAVAGVGALHGLNPATGWLFAAARGVRARDSGQALRALAPITVGHAASVALVAAAVATGLVMDRAMLRWLAAGLFAGIMVHQLWRFMGRRRRAPGGPAALALWSLMISTAHGAGLMLVPALIPLCLSDTPAREITASGSMVMALAAVGVHTAAMLAVTGVIATVACVFASLGGSAIGNALALRRLSCLIELDIDRTKQLNTDASGCRQNKARWAWHRR